VKSSISGFGRRGSVNVSVKNFLMADPPKTFGRGIKMVALAGLILAYALVIPLKSKSLLPPTVTWVGVVLVPLLMFLSLSGVLIFPVRTPREKWIMAAFSFVCCAAGMGVVYWQGWV